MAKAILDRPSGGVRLVRPRSQLPIALLRFKHRYHRVPQDYSLAVPYENIDETVSKLQALLPRIGQYIALDDCSVNSIPSEMVRGALDMVLEETIESCELWGRLWLPRGVIRSKQDMSQPEVMKRKDYILTIDGLRY